MYNREKIIQTLRDIKKEAETISPYVVIAQPRRNKQEIAAQSFNGYGLNHLNLAGRSFAFVDCEGMLVDVARNYLIERAINDSDAKYMFFIGEDTVVPYDAFTILLETAEANPGSVVAGVYYIKCSHPMISVKEGNYINVPNVDPGQVFDAWQTGMDCMLIPTEVLRSMQREEPELPFCCIANDIEDIPFVGEDNFFVHRLRRHGVRLLVNTDVQCLHMDLATGKYTAHPDVNLKKYYTNIKPSGVLTLDDKDYIDHRWTSRLPGAENNPHKNEQWLPGQDIPKLIEYFSKPVGIEIGVAQGYTSKYLMEEVADLTLHGIDPYEDYVDWDGVLLNGNILHSEAKMKLEKYPNFIFHKKTSDDAEFFFNDDSVHFVFIDGLHTYEQVLKDAKNYWPKLVKGGILIGHDYTRIQGVNKAANEFASEVNLAIRTAKQDLWYIVKE